MTQRTAALNLEWERTGNGEWAKNLPAIPGYPSTQTEGDAQVVVQPTGEGFGFDIYIIPGSGVDYIHLDNRDFGIPDTDTAEEMMDIVDNLSLRDIADMLDDMGYGPIDNPTASRHATRRAASLDLDWERDEEYCRADLPAIPGYSGGAIATLTLKDTEDIENPWDIDIIYYPADSAQDPVTVDCWSIHGFNPDTVSYWSLMNAVDELDINAIGDALNNLGVEPDED